MIQVQIAQVASNPNALIQRFKAIELQSDSPLRCIGIVLTLTLNNSL
jgi:hypothetical protein